MRILHLTNRWEPGGIQRHIRDLAQGQRSEGHDVWIAAWNPAPQDIHEDIPFVPLPLYRDVGRRKSPFGFVQSLHILAGLLKDHGIDLVHMHSRYVLPLGHYIARNRAGKVYTAHYHDSNLKWLPWYPRHILFPSAWMEGVFQDILPHSERYVRHVIPHGIVAPAQTTSYNGRKSAGFVFVGRHVPQKGGDVLIRAVHQLEREGHPVRVQFLGDGESRATWEHLARELGVTSLLEFTGWVQNPGSFFPDATALVAPSLPALSESFGYVIIEAMLSGCPILASDLPSYREIDGGNDILHFFEPGNTGALARLMLDVVEHPPTELRNRRGVELARREHSVDRMVRETFEVYTECAGEAAAERA